MLRGVVGATVLTLTLLLAGCSGEEPIGSADPEVAPTDTETVPNDAAPGPSGAADPDEFCTAYRALADAQAMFAAETTGAEVDLRASADTLLALGIPADMPDAARLGYATELGGVYGSLGVELDMSVLELDGGPDPEEHAEEHEEHDHEHEHDASDPTYALITYMSNHCPA